MSFQRPPAPPRTTSKARRGRARPSTARARARGRRTRRRRGGKKRPKACGRPRSLSLSSRTPPLLLAERSRGAARHKSCARRPVRTEGLAAGVGGSRMEARREGERSTPRLEGGPLPPLVPPPLEEKASLLLRLLLSSHPLYPFHTHTKRTAERQTKAATMKRHAFMACSAAVLLVLQGERDESLSSGCVFRAHAPTAPWRLRTPQKPPRERTRRQ